MVARTHAASILRHPMGFSRAGEAEARASGVVGVGLGIACGRLQMLFGGSVRPCVVPDWVVGLSVHSENIGRTWVPTTRRWWASTVAYPPGLACRPGGEAAKHITTIHIYPILLVWHADRERGKQPYTQQPSSWGLARGSSLVALGSWLLAHACLCVCVCAHALC